MAASAHQETVWQSLLAPDFLAGRFLSSWRRRLELLLREPGSQGAHVVFSQRNHAPMMGLLRRAGLLSPGRKLLSCLWEIFLDPAPVRGLVEAGLLPSAPWQATQIVSANPAANEAGQTGRVRKQRR